MKLKEDPEQENEKLDDVSFEQAIKLDALGFDWNCGSAFDKDGQDVNWTTKHFFCWKPTIQLALKFIRKRYGINHDVHTRSWNLNLFGYSIGHSFIHIDMHQCDISEKSDRDSNYDGIVSFDYDEAQNIALDYAIRYLLKDLERDFSWLQPENPSYIGGYEYVTEKRCSVPIARPLIVLERNEKLRLVKVLEGDREFWIEFHKLHPTAEEAIRIETEE